MKPTITHDVSIAAKALAAGNTVAIPTETVYGLAARIYDLNAVHHVYTLKNRPLNHPLIVHVAPDFDIDLLVDDVSDYARLLMKHCWPGPLTMVFKLKDGALDKIITGNQDSVAIRCPAHPLAIQLLQQLKEPVVAPSANPFGKVSPTTAAHVADAFKHHELLILDGGRSTVGIESTLIDVRTHEGFNVLRHGMLTAAELERISGVPELKQDVDIRVSGKLKTHYMPDHQLYYFPHEKSLFECALTMNPKPFVLSFNCPDGHPEALFLKFSDDPRDFAYTLYDAMRLADKSKAQETLILLPPDTPEWQGVRERIIKAGRPFART